MKGGTIMKAMRYLLSVIVILSVTTLGAQNLSQYPAIQMQSTSSMVSSGSTLPQAAITGVYTTYDSPTGGPRRSKKEVDPFGEETIGDVTNPQQPGTPIGDGTWILMFLAVGYAFFIAWRRKVAKR